MFLILALVLLLLFGGGLIAHLGGLVYILLVLCIISVVVHFARLK